MFDFDLDIPNVEVLSKEKGVAVGMPGSMRSGGYEGVLCTYPSSLLGDCSYACREQFHNAIKQPTFKQVEGVFTICNSVERMSAVLDWTERALNLKEKTEIQVIPVHAQYKRYNNSDAYRLLLKTSNFWISNPLRFFFFTALTRTACSSAKGYQAGHWMHPLDLITSISYFNQSARATARFLYGRTYYADDKHDFFLYNTNWVQMMTYSSSVSQLQCPPKNEVEKYFDGGVFKVNLTPAEILRLNGWVKANPANGFGDLKPNLFDLTIEGRY